MEGISIIIPLGGETNLEKLLNSINYDLYELLIIGNNIDKSLLTRYRINFIKTNVKRSEARNIGSINARNKYLLFLDSDMELTSNFIESALNKIKNFDALIFPEITVGKSIIAKGRRFERAGLYKTLYYEAPRMIKKDVFVDLGGYSQELNAFEDLDLTRKLLNNNFKIGWCDNIIIHHEEDVNLLNYIRKRINYTKTNKNIFSNNDMDFFNQVIKLKNRYNAFINSIRIYKLQSLYYIPSYLVVTLINVFTFMIIK